MANLRAITAISDAPFESLVAKTLFDNGWDVERRVLHAADILIGTTDLILLSLDVEGINQELLHSIELSGARVIAFGPNPHSLQLSAASVFPPTQDSQFLLSILRGNQREPLLQSQNAIKSKRRPADLVYVCSARHSVGASFVSANIAMEISSTQKRVMLIDGDLAFPSLYDHLGVRDISHPQALSPFLTVVELHATETESHLQLLERWSYEFDVIVLDGGAISRSNSLAHDRRIEAGLVMWALDRAHHHIAVTTSRDIDMASHRTLLANLAQAKPHKPMTSIINMSSKGIQHTLDGTVVYLPNDARTVMKCKREKLLLSEAAPRSPLTKQLAQFVREGLL